jgi:rod shape-determining protein MreD
MYEGRGNGTVWGMGTGFIEDALSSGLLGAHALTRTLVSFFAGSIMSYRTLQSAYSLYASLTVGILALFNNLILFIIIVQGSAGWLKGLLVSVFLPALYTMFWAVIIFSIVPDAIWEKIYKTEPTPFI